MANINFRDEVYPEDLLLLTKGFQNIIDKIDKELKEGLPYKYYVKDFISQPKNELNRKWLREIYTCNSTHRTHIGKEIKGLYIFAEGALPSYVGISGTVINRLYQHIFSKHQNQASFAFNMAMYNHNLSNSKYVGERQHFPFDDYREKLQSQIKDMRLIIIPVDNNFELHMVEPYLACHYKCMWNSFETH